MKRKTSNSTKLRLSTKEMRWRCPAGFLKERPSTGKTKAAETCASGSPPGIVGQRRAVDALALGLEIDVSGYNIFVTGPAGTGRTTTVRLMLERFKTERRELDDKCYVNNFRDPDQPRLLRLAPGKGRGFQQDMEQLVAYLTTNIPTQFESEAYQRSRNEIVERFKEEGSAKVREFEKKVAAEGFALVQTAPFVKPELAPIVEKQPSRMEALSGLVEENKLTAERAEDIRARYRGLTEELSAIFKEIREQERMARETLAELDANVVRPVLDERLGDIAERYAAGRDKLKGYLEEVNSSILGNIDLFRQRPQEKPESGLDPYAEYRVNVLVDNSETPGAPVVFETNPNYKNVFGAIERTADKNGQLRADFTRIKAGSIARADGGFLVLNALDALIEPGVWPALKRTLRNRRLEITSLDPLFPLLSTSALKPEPIAINLKVVMIGDPYVYEVLALYDEDFKKVFKVRADFDWELDLDRNSVGRYCRVLKALCEKERLVRFDTSAIQRVVEYGVRLAGRQNRLTTRFNVISDIMKEASYWAKKDGAKAASGRHVDRAIEKRRDRVRLGEEKLQEFIDDGTIMIDVKGRVVGQVNGLAVYDTGEYVFGKPTRITAKTGVGSAGIINIEREARLSGPTHDKGVYILSGYLRNRFARRHPLALSASITFEQSYGGVDGDSASSTEVYALLSDLSEIPLRQDLAVTGSVNQQGQVQAIGGVNQKIEGFFYTCRARGLTGTQGVIIPRANARDLMLRDDVVAAVKKKEFSVYAVDTIEEGIELLTGVPAGRPDKKGNYPADTVYGRTQKKLAELAELHRRFQSPEPDQTPRRRSTAVKSRTR